MNSYNQPFAAPPRPGIRTTAYRVPSEQGILALTLLVVLVVLGISATLTLCTSALFLVGMVVMAYQLNAAHHRSLMQHALAVTPQTQPEIATLVQESTARLQPGPVAVYVAPGQNLNAYTFGMSEPNVVVLYSPLFQVMDRTEIQFILGHELGHVALGHTWLNSLIGGLAGIPTPYSAALILTFVFRWWNRACELSSDRAGLLACGNLDKAISALVKLVAGPDGLNNSGYQRALAQIEAEDDTAAGYWMETLATHPMLIRRINELRAYAASPEYQQHRALVERNRV